MIAEEHSSDRLDPEVAATDVPCGFITTTAGGLIIAVNETLLEATGYSRAELVRRKTFAELLSAGGRIYHETHYAPMLEMQGSAREIALDIVTAAGERLPVLVNSVADRDEDGETVAIRTAIFEAKHRREYERELLRAKERAEISEARASELARTLQRTLIPPTPPDIPGLDLAAAYRPAGSGDEVGGDFYDVFQIGAGDWVIALGDVCGKGVDAAAVTALVRHTLRAVTVQLPQPREALRALNEVLLRHGTERFCTVVLMRLRHRDERWCATVCSGGHPLPLLVHGTTEPQAVGVPGSLIGVLAEPDLQDQDVVLEPGSSLIAYTDGITEARGRHGFYGDARLRTYVAGGRASADDLVSSLLNDVVSFQDGRPRDDIAIVAVRVPDTQGAGPHP